MLVLLSMTSAFALTCDAGDDLCNAVNDMAATINANAPGTPVADGASRIRLQPQWYLDNLQTALDAAFDGGCTTTTDLDTYVSAYYVYDRPGAIAGAWEAGALTNGAVGSLKFSGTMEGLDDFGTNFSAIANGAGKIIADRDGGFVAGYFGRISGRKGVFMAVTGTCDGAATAPVALGPWFPNSLNTWDDAPSAFDFRTEGAGSYTRVDRMGMPAVATALIASKDAYNDADPTDDVAGLFVGEIVGTLDFLHGALDDDLTGLGLTPCTVLGGTGTCVTQGAPLILPDTLKIDPSSPAGFPNGRKLADPVIDVTLAVVLLDLGVHGAGLFAGLPLNPPANDVPFSGSFPFLAPAH